MKCLFLFILFFIVVPLTITADINAELLQAAEQGDTSGVRALLQRGADVNDRGTFVAGEGESKPVNRFRTVNTGIPQILLLLWNGKT